MGDIWFKIENFQGEVMGIIDVVYGFMMVIKDGKMVSDDVVESVCLGVDLVQFSFSVVFEIVCLMSEQIGVV